MVTSQKWVGKSFDLNVGCSFEMYCNRCKCYFDKCESCNDGTAKSHCMSKCYNDAKYYIWSVSINGKSCFGQSGNIDINIYASDVCYPFILRSCN